MFHSFDPWWFLRGGARLAGLALGLFLGLNVYGQAREIESFGTDSSSAGSGGDLDLAPTEFPRLNFLGSMQRSAWGGFDPAEVLSQISLNYFAMVSSPSFPGQAARVGESFVLRNFLGAGYRLGPSVVLSGNANWSVRGMQQLPTQVHDPFVRLSDASFLSGENWNLYLDGRIHIPVSTASMNSGLNLGIQSVQSLTYSIPESRLALGLSSSIRYNFLSSKGVGNQIDVYLAPSLFYQLGPSIGFNCLAEAMMSHLRQPGTSNWIYPSLDVEPGLAWDLLPNLNLNPYVHIPIDSTKPFLPSYAGVLLSWTLL
jgi:hypothetical protein